MQTRAVQEAQRPLVLDVLDAAVELDVTVIRAWAFCDGPEEWQAMQPEPGTAGLRQAPPPNVAQRSGVVRRALWLHDDCLLSSVFELHALLCHVCGL